MEEWVSTWVRAQRSESERGIEIKSAVFRPLDHGNTVIN
jgi:hypothetical protein